MMQSMTGFLTPDIPTELEDAVVTCRTQDRGDGQPCENADIPIPVQMVKGTGIAVCGVCWQQITDIVKGGNMSDHYDPNWIEESEDDGTTRADGLDKPDGVDEDAAG